MQRTKPPFRADEVGSLLRPPKIKEARAKLEKGEISADELRKIEDMEIEKVVHKQASVGLKLATDGEFRRSWWHFDFLSHLTGCELFHPDMGIQFAGVQTRHDAIRVIGKLDFSDQHPMLDHFRFLKKYADQAHVTPKMTIPSPAVLHFRGGRKLISKEVYPDLEEFYQDLGKTYRKAVKAFYDAGCRYLQFDDTVWAYLCSPVGTAEVARPRRQSRRPAGDLRACHQLRDRRSAVRHGDHHACLPRQLPLDLDLLRWLRAGRRDHARRHQLRRVFPRI
ncbi:methionine synthase II (cobalamin-independent) [Bradyrhizobium sp. USDA 4473]